MPLLVRLPNIPGLLEVGATSMPAGFRLVLGSCPDAHAFEVVYAESPVQPDFTSNTVGHLIATNRTIDISVPSGRVWNVKVRPLQGGQCVGAAVSASVTSGSSSSVGQEIPLAQFRIHLRSYSTLYLATSLYERPGDESFAFSNVRGIDSALIQDIPTEYIGRIFLDILGHEFVLSEKRDQLAFDMIDVDGLGASPTPAPGTPIVNGTIQANKIYRVVGFASVKYNSIVVTTNQQFVGVAGVVSWTDEVGSGSIVQVGIINGSRRGRNVYRSEYYTQDYRLTRVAVRADVVVGNPVLVWYQDSAPTQYDTYAVPAGNGATTFKETSVIISRDKGIRSLVVDLWDPSLANQAAPQSSGLTGLVTIYGIPYHNVSAIQTD